MVPSSIPSPRYHPCTAPPRFRQCRESSCSIFGTDSFRSSTHCTLRAKFLHSICRTLRSQNPYTTLSWCCYHRNSHGLRSPQGCSIQCRYCRSCSNCRIRCVPRGRPIWGVHRSASSSHPLLQGRVSTLFQAESGPISVVEKGKRPVGRGESLCKQPTDKCLDVDRSRPGARCPHGYGYVQGGHPGHASRQEASAGKRR